MRAAAALALALAVALELAWWAWPEAPRPHSAFDGARASADQQFLAHAARPIASKPNEQARHYLMQRLRAAGLVPLAAPATIQTMHVDRHGQADLTLAVVHNILVRLPGRAPGAARRPALLLAADYDSASVAPAALLEVLRQLLQDEQRNNDVIVLLADGAAVGGLGARAFAEQHPWARAAGLVISLDGPGGSGAPRLSATRGGDGKLVRAWAAAAPQAGDSSLVQDDAGWQLRGVGLVGMRIAPGSLRQTGEAMLALARHGTSVSLEAIAAPDHVYFTLPGYGLVHYSVDLVWPLTRTICLVFLVTSALAAYRARTPLRMLVLGLLALMVLVLLAASLLRPAASYLLAWPLVGVLSALAMLHLRRVAAWPFSRRLALLSAGLVPTLLLGLGTHLPPGAAPPVRLVQATYLKDAHTWKSLWVEQNVEAPRSSVAFPHVVYRKHEHDGKTRRVDFMLQSKNAAPMIRLDIKSAAVLQASVNGHALRSPATPQWRLTLYGMGGQPLDFRFRLDGATDARLHVQEHLPGLPGNPVLPARMEARTVASDLLVFR